MNLTRGQIAVDPLASAKDDPLYELAKQTVIATNHASISGVQRRLVIGFNRAARLIEQMELDGIVSAPGFKGERSVLPLAGEVGK